MALGGHIEASSRMSAFWSEADMRGRVAALVSTLLTQLGHKQAAFAAMHGFDLLYSA